MEKMKRQIKLSDELYDFLKSQAVKKDETFDEILKRLLKKTWSVNFTEQTPAPHCYNQPYRRGNYARN